MQIRAGGAVFADDGVSLGFLTDPAIRPVRGSGNLWELADQPLIWRRTDGTLDVISVGYRCNLASIPKAVHGLDHPASHWLIRGSVVHDWQCEHHDERGSDAVHRQWGQMVGWDAETWVQRTIKRPTYERLVRWMGPRW
jgi:hypothetical protein